MSSCFDTHFCNIMGVNDLIIFTNVIDYFLFQLFNAILTVYLMRM